MIKFKSASLLRILAIISAALIIIGMTLGTILHFTTGEFFNYGGEYSSFKSVTVEYYSQEVNGTEEIAPLDIGGVCEEAFSAAGVSYYVKTESADSGAIFKRITYRFYLSADTAALQSAADAINAKITEYTQSYIASPMSHVSVGENNTLPGGGYTLSMAAVVLAVIIAIHAIYVLIRYKLSAMCTAFVADLHNLALYAAVLAICRIPVTSSVLAFGILIVLVTVICTTFTLDRIKRNLKDKEGEKLSAAEITYLSAAETRKSNIAISAFFAVIAALVFVMLSISSLSPIVILSAPLCALAAFAVATYGNVLFVPAIYPVLRSLCGKIHLKPSPKKEKSK